MRGSAALPSVLLVTGDPVGERMAGPAIRAVELARVLTGAGHPTIVAAPAVDEAPAGLDVRPVTGEEELRALAEGVDVVVGFSAVLAEHPWLFDTGVPVVVDAYDPGLLETVERFRGRPVNEQRDWLDDARRHLLAPLAGADLVLVASERQRHYVLGLLTAAGRVNGRTVAEDPTLRSLCAVVPFGLPARPPTPRTPGPLGRGTGGLRTDAVVALWGGGLYDWLDPLSLVEGVARCEDDRVAGVFLAGPHPTAAVGRLPLVDRARARARELGLLGNRVHFVEEWVPYAERGAWLRDADIGVSLHLDHVETTFAFRTRILDYLWAGLPVVCSVGDHFAEVVASQDLGHVVGTGDVDAVAAALAALASASDAERAQRRSRLRAVADDHEWSVVTVPLVDWCRAPRLAADRRVGPEQRSLRRRLARWLRG